METDATLEAYAEHAAAAVGVPIAAAHRPGVLRFLALARDMAATLDEVDLADDDLALAPVYRLPGAEGERP